MLFSILGRSEVFTFAFEELVSFHDQPVASQHWEKRRIHESSSMVVKDAPGEALALARQYDEAALSAVDDRSRP